MSEKIKNTWGGKRKGAGRPVSGKETGKVYTFRLNPTEARIVDSQKNRSEFVRECILRSIVEDGVGDIVPANPEFKRIKITPEDDFRVWGTVTYIIHKPRE